MLYYQNSTLFDPTELEVTHLHPISDAKKSAYKIERRTLIIALSLPYTPPIYILTCILIYIISDKLALLHDTHN